MRIFANNVEPIVNNHTLRWVDKSKGLAYLSSASQPVQQEIDRQVLEDAAKVIKNFENPLTDDDLRFRTVSNGAARREYDERVRTRKKENPGDKRAEKRTNHAAQLHEAYMDGMRSLRVLQEAVSHETGSEIESHEDAYEYENQLSSRNKSGEEEYTFKNQIMGNIVSKQIEKRHCQKDNVTSRNENKNSFKLSDVPKEELLKRRISVYSYLL